MSNARIAAPVAAVFVVLLVVFAWTIARADRTPGQEPQADGQASSVQFSPALVPPTGSVPERAEAAVVDASYEESPRQLTAEECREARPRMEALAALAGKRVEESGDAGLRDLLAARLQESRAWFDAGCPADAVLGIYPAKDGSGSKNILLDFPGRP